jgi:hypothetical protein
MTNTNTFELRVNTINAINDLILLIDQNAQFDLIQNQKDKIGQLYNQLDQKEREEFSVVLGEIYARLQKCDA